MKLLANIVAVFWFVLLVLFITDLYFPPTFMIGWALFLSTILSLEIANKY
jgi:hypothetical protein